MKDLFIRFIDRDEVRRWANEYVSDFYMKHLWIPKDPEFTKLGLFCLFNNK